MTSSTINIKDWLGAMKEATAELTTSTLGFDGCTLEEVTEEIPIGLSGSYISLVGDTGSLQLGLVTDKKNCQSLAKAMLGMGSDEADLPDGDVVDAMGEIVNIVAGGVKRQMSGTMPSIQLGLPLFFTGQIESGDHQEAVVAQVQLGPVPARLLILRKKES